jgi:hypothetical protein
MLPHIECPRCHAPNLTTEVICFACGASLRARPKHLAAGGPASTPWPLWVGLLFAVVIAGFAAWCLAVSIAAYRARAALPAWYLPVAGLLLTAVGQLAFLEARRRDRRWWRLRRAPELKLSQATVGDTIWAHGRLACDTPIIAPYVGQQCAYFRYLVREREPGQSGWRITERGANAVDFRLVQEDHSLYVPSGSVLFDAPLYGESLLDPEGTTQVRVWALPLGLPLSLCALLAGETPHPRADPPGEDLPVVATWRSARDYVALVGRYARMAYLAGWTATVLAVLAFIAALAGR